jgi:opacity protein-like surface antigen
MVNRFIRIGGVCVMVLVWCASAVWAQEEPRPPQIDPYLALFGGVTFPSNTDGELNNGGLTLTVMDQDFGRSKSLGGKVGAWFPGLRRSTGLDYGLEIDVTNYQPDVKAGRFRASGTFNGIPVNGTVSSSRDLDVNATIVAANVLLRLPLYVSDEFPNGRLYPYLGGGPGIQKSTFGSEGRSDFDLALQAVAGVQLFLVKRVSLFAEYKFTHASQTFGFRTSTGATQDETYTFNVSHAAAGLAVHFGP